MLAPLMNLGFAGGGETVDAGAVSQRAQWRFSRYQHGHHYRYARVKAWAISCLMSW